MKEKSVKLLKYESLLTELIGEAVGQLRDERLCGLNVLSVECAKGKDNATVYLDGSDITLSERQEILKQLKISSGFIVKYCLALEDWYKMPKLAFKFDDSLAQKMKLEEIFHKLELERTKEND